MQTIPVVENYYDTVFVMYGLVDFVRLSELKIILYLYGREKYILIVK